MAEEQESVVGIYFKFLEKVEYRTYAGADTRNLPFMVE